MLFYEKVAKLLNIYVGNKTQEEVEGEVVNKLESKNKIEESNRRVTEQTSGMSEAEKRRYFESWSGMGQ